MAAGAPSTHRPRLAVLPRPLRLLRQAWADEQHRNALYLMLNAATGAATGLAFWLLLTRVARLPASEVGIGYTVVAVGTTVGLLAKGGLDTALLRAAPATGADGTRALLRMASAIAAACSLVLAAMLAVATAAGGGLPHLSASAWGLVAAIGALLAWTWLQDARFLAEGDASWTLRRNLVFAAARLLLPVPLAVLLVPNAVAVAWAAALAASGVAAAVLARRMPARAGPPPDTGAFLRTASHNATGSAAEFLPGLLLAPIVLAARGPAEAAYFGVAWTAASLLFLLSSAVSRSALAQLVRHPGQAQAALRRGVRQNALLVAPAALACAVLAPLALAAFGADYAAHGTTLLVLLAASVALVSPTYLYLSLLRARGQAATLVLMPVAMVACLLAAVPPLTQRWGLPGAGWAWILANLPFALWACWRLAAASREVSLAAPVARGADVE